MKRLTGFEKCSIAANYGGLLRCENAPLRSKYYRLILSKELSEATHLAIVAYTGQYLKKGYQVIIEGSKHKTGGGYIGLEEMYRAGKLKRQTRLTLKVEHTGRTVFVLE